MPYGYGSYDLDANGSITPQEWEQAVAQNPQQQSASGGGDYDFAQILDFFTQMQELGGSGGFTPEMLEGFGIALPMMGMKAEFDKAAYQEDALAFMSEELGLKRQELDLAKQQMEFESGPAWEWYKNEFFPMSMENQRLEWETQRQLMEGQVAQSGEESKQARERTLQALQGTLQSKQSTRQAEMATEVARYNALSQLGPQNTTRRLEDGRQVRGSGFTYGYGR
jgi:hypothetical protein